VNNLLTVVTRRKGGTEKTAGAMGPCKKQPVPPLTKSVDRFGTSPFLEQHIFVLTSIFL